MLLHKNLRRDRRERRVTINQCLDVVERVRRGEADAGAFLDSLRRTHTAPVVDLADTERATKSVAAPGAAVRRCDQR